MKSKLQFSAVNNKISYQTDPLSLYQLVTQNCSHSMLLESAEIDSKAHLKSLIMTDAAMMIRCDHQNLTFVALTINGQHLLPQIALKFENLEHQLTGNSLTITLEPSHDVLDEDQKLLSQSPLDGLRAILSLDEKTSEHQSIFLGGVFSFDFIACIESLPKVKQGDNQTPDYVFYLAEQLITLDHTQKKASLTTYSFSFDESNTAKLADRSQQITHLAKMPPVALSAASVDAEPRVNMCDETFKAHVSELKQHIIEGDIFQIVPSRSFSLPCPNTLGAYSTLKQTNPSPYMFYFRGEDFTLFGASPESALKYEADSNQVEIYPIAGTRKRGKDEHGDIDADLDCRIELELRLDKKELAEHLMLVDLGRNDIARISQAGTRKVPELLKVDRYSHVMHLVSRVTGQLQPHLDALHAYQACMNMGTLTGAPKIKASQLIRQVEGQRRGSYGGAVGYINSQGDMDTCIVIRSAYVKDNVAHVQAGAGVVFDSDPQAEADETRQKAQAVISAIQLGGGL
ncbi:anthranilate synthase component 1 [Parashewanella curva]|uniref:Anthranilate synthase component 1 n=1 Tax=Parashewanella curva TaxID=2338552 RepID=A0A3L8Q397_9GAMM|nr:anthranilate synthase component 1 [Parashewanella curva]RLV61102.1 anthranilate synthase component 1 [Parashewanella curva]